MLHANVHVFNIFPKGDILTSCVLNVCHGDLHPCILGEFKKANNKIAEPAYLLASRRNVPLSNSVRLSQIYKIPYDHNA